MLREFPRLLRQWPTLVASPLLLGLIVLAAISVWGTGQHTAHVLSHPYPLDYGEGPLMAQVGALMDGTPLHRLYSDPVEPPYLVVNYPPVALLLTQAAASMASAAGAASPVLLGGRIVALIATALAAAALAPLATLLVRPTRYRRLALLGPLLLPGISLVREWSTLLRVDMVALALALWALVAALRAVDSRNAALLAGLLGALAVLAKPSFVAAPVAATLWLLMVAPRRGLLVALTGAAVGGVVGLGLEWASGGWFIFHVLRANVNRFDGALASYFWREHLLLMWPLALAACVGLLQLALRVRTPGALRQRRLVLPLLYLCGALASAIGVGKVGAYSNYFLELDAALVWLAVGGLLAVAQHEALTGRRALLIPAAGVALLVLLLGHAARYHPLWDETRPRSAALEFRKPRLLVGRYPLWRDLGREREVLAGQARVHLALQAEVRAAGPVPLITDTPGVVIAGGGVSQLQAFEMRQLLDAGMWSQDAILLRLANGEVPLVPLEWLGNWLSPETIELLTYRYVRSGSLGVMMLYRPVAIGPFVAAEGAVEGGPDLLGYHLLPPIDGSYRPAEQVALTAVLGRGALPSIAGWSVDLALLDDGTELLSATDRLLYGALPDAAWPTSGTVQHIARLTLPNDLPPGRYELALTINGPDGQRLRRTLPLSVGPPLGRIFPEVDRYVPAPLLERWVALGGLDMAGYPMTPPLPLEGRWRQCFERACLDLLPDGRVEQLPLGELLSLPLPQPPAPQLSGPFLSYWERRAEALGPAVSGEFQRGWPLMQYTRYARLERAPDGTDVSLGRLGAEYLLLNDFDRVELP